LIDFLVSLCSAPQPRELGTNTYLLIVLFMGSLDRSLFAARTRHVCRSLYRSLVLFLGLQIDLCMLHELGVYIGLGRARERKRVTEREIKR